MKGLAGVDLSELTGISAWGALVLVSENGNDMERWPNAKAFASWLGLAPNHKISGGKILSNRTRPVANRAATVLRLMAIAAGRRTETPLGSFYRRIQARSGSPKAIHGYGPETGLPRLPPDQNGRNLRPPALEDYNERFRKIQTKWLAKRPKACGFKLVPIQAHAE